MSDGGFGGGDPRFVWGAGPTRGGAAPPPGQQPYPQQPFQPYPQQAYPQQAYPPGYPGYPGAGGAGPRRRRASTAAIVVTSVALGLGLAGLGTWALGLVGGDDWPTPGRESAAQPLGVPPVVSAPSPAYSFMALQDDGVTPVAYDPCRPVHYVVRPEGEPAGGRQMITEAFLRLSQATGLQFVDDGETDESPSADRDPYQPDLYGDRWAPVLISWSDQGETTDLGGDVAGLGGSVPVSYLNGTAVYVTGQVLLDGPAFTEAMSHPGGGPVARAVVLHELGHVVGLGHVDDPEQLMYPYAARSDLGAGDLTGLALLGAGGCVPEV
ncbi:matrixin family metalloprotease [Cellulomonas soli]|uniref:matrixin family metalloprotease n=1 Tax=Cellulomonas soli TaxID=931535 RepID=UPI003F826BE5